MGAPSRLTTCCRRNPRHSCTGTPVTEKRRVPVRHPPVVAPPPPVDHNERIPGLRKVPADVADTLLYAPAVTRGGRSAAVRPVAALCVWPACPHRHKSPHYGDAAPVWSRETDARRPKRGRDVGGARAGRIALAITHLHGLAKEKNPGNVFFPTVPIRHERVYLYLRPSTVCPPSAPMMLTYDICEYPSRTTGHMPSATGAQRVAGQCRGQSWTSDCDSARCIQRVIRTTWQCPLSPRRWIRCSVAAARLPFMSFVACARCLLDSSRRMVRASGPRAARSRGPRVRSCAGGKEGGWGGSIDCSGMIRKEFVCVSKKLKIRSEKGADNNEKEMKRNKHSRETINRIIIPKFLLLK